MILPANGKPEEVIPELPFREISSPQTTHSPKDDLSHHRSEHEKPSLHSSGIVVK
jgi:hypothetical protein